MSKEYVHLKLKDEQGREAVVTQEDGISPLDLCDDYFSVKASLDTRLVAAMKDLERAAQPLTEKEKLARAYNNVLGVIKGACNASGVVLSFAEDIIAVRHGEALGTDETNTHPLVLLYLHQLVHLALNRELLTQDEFDTAMRWVRGQCSKAE